MPDFKGRKDFPEVADDKIKIGDYSGSNRMAVVNIYTPKEEPELLDRVMETVKGPAANDYDSRILSQQPVIILDDTRLSEEEGLIKGINSILKAFHARPVVKKEQSSRHTFKTAHIKGISTPLILSAIDAYLDKHDSRSRLACGHNRKDPDHIENG